MLILIKAITIILAVAFCAALTLTAHYGAHLRRMGYPHHDRPVSRHTRWAFRAGALIAVTVVFIEIVVVRYFGRQYTLLFWVQLAASVACAVFFILAATLNGRRMEGRASLHHAFGTLTWYCGIVSVALGIIVTLRLHP